MKYKNRVRSRISNLKDAKNPNLRKNVLCGNISPDLFARMTAEVSICEYNVSVIWLHNVRCKDYLNHKLLYINTTYKSLLSILIYLYIQYTRQITVTGSVYFVSSTTLPWSLGDCICTMIFALNHCLKTKVF